PIVRGGGGVELPVGGQHRAVVYIKAKSSPPGPYGLLGAALAIVAVFGLHCLLHPPFTVPHFLPLHPPFARRLRLHLPTILNHASGLWAIFPWSWQRKNPRSSRDFDDGTIRSFPLVDPIGSRGSDMAQPFVKKDDDLDEEGGLSTLFDPSLMFFCRISGFLLDFVVEYSPFYGIEKGAVLQEARVFHDPQLDARRCSQVSLSQILIYYKIGNNLDLYCLLPCSSYNYYFSMIILMFHLNPLEQIGFFLQIRQNDRLAVSKLVTSLTKGSLRSPLAQCLLIRYTSQVFSHFPKEVKSQPLAEKKAPGKKAIGLGAAPSGPTSVVDAYEKLLSSIPEFSSFGKLFKVIVAF
ncbi:hypothetical protein GW17_00044920, partial [Ensete ventricosum]